MSKNDSQIEFEQTSIAEALRSYELCVPRYQRDYSWDVGLVEAYLNDLNAAITQDESVYFLGSLVVVNRGANKLEVIDGQQRLATTSLLLAAMKHQVAENSNIAQSIGQFLVSLDMDSFNDSKLTLNSSDLGVFSSLIQSGEVGDSFIPNRPSHARLSEAYEKCSKFMISSASLHAEVNKDELFERWLGYLRFSTKVILIKVLTELNAFRMFETLNDRGLKVSQTDLIKNHLFSLAELKIDTAQDHWAKVKGTLEAMENDDIMMNFIRHSLMATNKFVQRKDIYEDIRDVVKGQNGSIDMLARWGIMSGHYLAIHNPESVTWKKHPREIKEHIRVINLFALQPLKPLLLSSASKLSPKECEKLFRYAITMSVRLTLASASRPTSMAVEKPLSEAAQKVWLCEFTTAKAVINNLTGIIPNDSEFRDEFMSATVSKAAIARYYLRTLERTYKREENPCHIPNEDPSSVTLEHILPLQNHENWPAFSAEEAHAYRKRIGNLALLKSKENSNIGSSGFAKKSETYKNSTFATTEMISEYKEWNSESISDRQSILCDLAVKAWPLQ